MTVGIGCPLIILGLYAIPPIGEIRGNVCLVDSSIYDVDSISDSSVYDVTILDDFEECE